VAEQVAEAVDGGHEEHEIDEELGHVLLIHEQIVSQKSNSGRYSGNQNDDEVCHQHAKPVLERIQAEKFHHVAQASLLLLEGEYCSHASSDRVREDHDCRES